MTFSAGETVTRVRRDPGGYDQLGDPLPGTEDRLDIPNCAVAPGGAGAQFSRELTDPGRRAVTGHLVLYTSAGADIRASDQVEVRGSTYLVDGNPGPWRSPYTGQQRGIQVNLRQVTEGAA